MYDVVLRYGNVTKLAYGTEEGYVAWKVMGCAISVQIIVEYLCGSCSLNVYYVIVPKDLDATLVFGQPCE